MTERANFGHLLQAWTGGRLSRRQFVARATALGLSAPLISVLAGAPNAFAQGATPAASGDSTGPRGPRADRLLFSAFNVDQAPLNIQNDDMDLYLFGLKTAAAQELARGAEGVRLIEAPASTISLILNPAPALEGQLNPFSIIEIRQAMQFLVDRDFVANDIYQGRAVAMRSHVSPLDYDALTIFETVVERDIRHDPERARAAIGEAMQAAGATLADNVWTFNGAPVILKIITRVEDERRDLGDLVRAALEGAGFQTQPIYQPFGPATLAVYASDPRTFQWHVYTEGWGRGAPDRYDFGTINQMAAPWLGNMPGWREVGYWQYEQEELDQLGQALYRGEFASQAERDDLYRQMTALALDESVRIWVVTALQSFPAREELKNVTEDLVSGPKSPFTLREAFVEGSDEIRVGHLWVWTERTTWNPVGGFGDVYSTDINRNLVDAAILNHPFTGIPIPFRANFEIETAGPEGTLEVPGDAVLWDAPSSSWQPVGGGVTAISKVTQDFSKFFQATYHHGQPITPADLIYSLAQSFEIAFDEEKLQIETALGVTSRPFLETFKGFRLLEDDQLEVYVDYWHFEPNYIASYANVTGVSTPWELLAGMDDVVFSKRQGAYSDTAAARFSVPWLSLVNESDARLVIRTLRQFGREGYVPAGAFEIGGRALVTPEEAQARYDASIAWFDEKNLLVISNGPFFLNRYDPPAQFAELLAFRPENYPFGPGDWEFGAAPEITIAPVEPPRAVLAEPIELNVTVEGPGELALRYILVDPAQGTVAASGEATPGEPGNFTVSIGADVTSTLFPSLYQLYLLASSDVLAQVGEQRLDLEIGL